MKPVLCIIASPPSASAKVAEQREAALVTAAFDMPTSILFRDEGVYCLLPNQQQATTGRRNVGKMLQGLATYDIEHVYVCQDSIAQRRINVDQLAIATQPLDFAAQMELLAAQQVVLGG